MISITAIKDLERKYMDEIWKLVSDKSFLLDLKEIEEYIQNNYIELDRNYQIKNKLQLAAERLLSFYVHKKLDVTKIYPSPISSDIAFFTKDCLINIDAKTIDLSGNRGDDKYIQFGPHQISFANKPLFVNSINGIDFEDMILRPGLPQFEPKTNLPCLTFFMGITYKDDGNSFMISHIKLACVPNGKIVEEDFDNNLIQNYKTYRYLKLDAARKLGKEYIPKDLKEFTPTTWFPFKLNSDDPSSGVPDTWLDMSLKNPFDKSKPVIWRVLAKKYHVCLGGDASRIIPKVLKIRKDGDNNDWIGIKELDFISAVK